MTKPRATPCGVCGSTQIVRIVYGLPGPGLMEEAKRGDVELGGCIVFPDQPERRCRSCGATWSTKGGWTAARGEGDAPADGPGPD
jgi:hypothetical protein